jgi:putative salt-induced outer membrane protein
MRDLEEAYFYISFGLEVSMKWFFLAMVASLLQSAVAADFTNESEAGVAVASGNTKSKNYNVKQANSYKFDNNVLKFDGRFLNAFANDTESARYLLGQIRYERILNELFSAYVSQALESDKFAGYDLRHVSDLGGQYNLYKLPMFYWLFEAGYRYTKEKEVNGSHQYKNSLRTYTEAEKKWNANTSTKYYIEYVPNLKHGKDYQINTELSVSAALSSVFSIKTAYLLRYDHEPAVGATQKTDTLLTTALVAKF